jgi:hypothetical protein
VKVLLKMVTQREVQKRPPGGCQFHACRQAALDNCEVRHGEVYG